MRIRFVTSILIATASPAIAVAQSPTAAAVSDTPRVVLETRLGGDSGQATLVELRAGGTYLLAVRPARAEMVIRRRVRDGAAVPALQLAPRPAADSVGGWLTWSMVALDAGQHVVELTNPQIGTTSIRISLLRRAAGDTLPTNMRRQLVWSENVSGGPSYVTLDSAVVYRIVVNDNAVISPRQQYRAPPFTLASFSVGPRGIAFVPSFTGEYRLDAANERASASIQIYKEAADQASVECFQNPGKPGCRGADPRRRKLGVLLAMLSVPIAAMFFLK